jgi:hypothetical protein
MRVKSRAKSMASLSSFFLFVGKASAYTIVEHLKGSSIG